MVARPLGVQSIVATGVNANIARELAYKAKYQCWVD